MLHANANELQKLRIKVNSCTNTHTNPPTIYSELQHIASRNNSKIFISQRYAIERFSRIEISQIRLIPSMPSIYIYTIHTIIIQLQQCELNNGKYDVFASFSAFQPGTHQVQVYTHYPHPIWFSVAVRCCCRGCHFIITLYLFCWPFVLTIKLAVYRLDLLQLLYAVLYH